MLLLMALVAVTAGDGVLGVLRGLLAAAVFLVGALVCLPPTRRWLAAAADVNVGRWAVVGIAVTALFAGAALWPPADSPAEEQPVLDEPTPTPTATPAATPTSTASGAIAEATPTDAATRTPGETEAPPPPPETPAPTATPAEQDGSVGSGQQGSAWTVTVVRVVDGDTIEVRFQDGHTEDVRLLGVDTPEVHVENDPTEFEGIPDNEEGRDWLRDWGHKASEFARAELSGETVRIETDDEAERRGSYGRLLVYLTHDGGEFNRQLLRQGYARMYDSMFSKRGAYADLEADARENGVGLWGFDDPGSGSDEATPTRTPVPDGGSEQLAVAEIHADAEGNDHENLNDEYVVFENTGDTTLDMGGWTVSDEADHTYTVPQGFTLEPGARVTLYTGSGEDSESELYWGSERAVWNNGGDTIYVRDDGGSLVLERSYS
jgi:micrococcal nuclease